MNLKNLLVLLVFLATLGSQSSSILLLGMVGAACTVLVANRHVSVSLIQLEMLTLLTAAVLLVQSWFSGFSTILFLLFFTVGVIEATLGLALLALTSRKLSTELFKFNL